MDGVLVDFVKGAEKQTGKSITKWAQGSKSEKWGQIKANPNLRNADRDNIAQACKGFKNHPCSP